MTPQTPPTDRPLTAGDWITHEGGPNPVPGQRVDVEHEGKWITEDVPSDQRDDLWRHDDPEDDMNIIAYRLARPATSAASEGEAWASLETAPMDGRPFYVRAQSPFRFHPYKPTSQEAKRGRKGRWQTMNEYGGWENCSPPSGDWKLHPDHEAALASPPVSERERELAVWAKVEATARRYAQCYPEASDGRNTFVMFAEWAASEALTAQPAGEGK